MSHLSQKSVFHGVVKKDLSLINSVSNTSEVTEWSHELYQRDYLQKATLYIKSTLAVAVGHAQVVIDFLMGNRDNMDTIGKSMLIVLRTMTLGGKDFCPETMIGQVQLPVAPAINADSWKYRFYKSQTGVETGTRIISNSGVNTEITVGSAETWAKEIIGLLSDEKNTIHHQVMINYVGFYILNILRAIVKDPVQIEEHICQWFDTRFLKFWTLNPLQSSVHPPSEECYIPLSVCLKKQSKDCDQLLTYLVESYHYSVVKKEANISGALKAGCLLSLSNVGLGIINWLNQAAMRVKIPLVELIEHLDNTLFAPTLRKVINLMVRLQENNDYSWPFARLFQETALSDLATKEDSLLVSFCIHLVKENDTDIWTAAQYAIISPTSRRMGRILAKAFLDVKMTVTEDQCYNDSAKTLMKQYNHLMSTTPIFQEENNQSEDESEDGEDITM